MSETAGPLIDRVLWEELAAKARRSLERSRRVVGIKGGPAVLALGHADHHFGQRDIDGSDLLKEWIAEDARYFNLGKATNRLL